MPRSFLIKNCTPKERDAEAATQPLDLQVLPFYGQNNMSGVHPASTTNTAMRFELPYSYNTYQGIQHFHAAPTFTWVPHAMSLSSPFHLNGNVPVLSVDNTRFPRQDLWRCSNPIYRMEETRKLVSGRGDSEATLPTEKDRLVRCLPPSTSAAERGQATIMLHPMHLGNASHEEIPQPRCAVSREAVYLPLRSSQIPTEVHSRRKHQSLILMKEERKLPRQKDDIKHYQHLPSQGPNDQNTSLVPTAMQSPGARSTTDSDTRADKRGYSPALGLSKDTDHRNIQGGMTARCRPESPEDEDGSSEAVKKLASANNRKNVEFGLHSPLPVTDNESSPSEEQNVEQGGKRRVLNQDNSFACSSSSNCIQSITKRTGQTPAKAKPKHQCDECGQTFTRSSTLTTHKRIHTGEKPYSCEQCGRAFRQLGNLSRHRLTHTTSKPYVCPHCDKAFNRASNLHTHMRTHSDYKPFRCEYCDKRFHQKIDMRIHRYTHTGEKPHKCSKCGRGFKQLTHLTYHLRIHSKERLYKCDVCGKGFNQKGNLKAHVYRHTGERPFKCDVCSKGFTLVSTLNTHKRIHAETKPFQCEFCDKAFYQKSALKTHCVASHPYSGGVLLL